MSEITKVLFYADFSIYLLFGLLMTHGYKNLKNNKICASFFETLAMSIEYWRPPNK